MNESVVAAIVLAVIAGGGIIVVDWLVVRKIRRVGPERRSGVQDEPLKDRSIDR